MIFFERLKRWLFPWFYTKSTPTVRHAFPLFLTLVSVLGAAALLSEDVTYISIEPDRETVLAGENFSIDVYVTAKVPVNAVDIKVKLPTTQVKILGVDTGTSVITLWTKEPYFNSGTVFLSGGTYRKGFIGKHRIATIKAEAKTSGLAYIEVSEAVLYAGDGTGAEVTVTDVGEDSTQLAIAREDGTFVPNVSISGEGGLGIVGDIDNDGRVTLKDISAFMSAWHQKSKVYDFSGDSKMTFRDFGIILARYFFQ
ncbi:hypothetical protein KC845_01640 [Candidatus Kaiserbacteria bacterium]|nr:hypothetical protein [Candidatus Kaiserbacteria bacterium]